MVYLFEKFLLLLFFFFLYPEVELLDHVVILFLIFFLFMGTSAVYEGSQARG